MTQELMDNIKAQFEDAIASGDAQQMNRAQARFAEAMMACQCKTADRVKQLRADVDVMKTSLSSLRAEIAPIKEGHDEYMKEKERRKGALWSAKIIYVIVSAGGGAALFELAKAFFGK